MRSSSLLLVPLAALVIAACSGGGSSSSTGGTGAAGGGAPGVTPTFHKDIEPILQKSCQSCHAPGKIAPFSLLTYADAKPMAGLMTMRTADRSMPPFGAQDTDECTPRVGWKHDLRLSEAQLALIKDWSAAGAPEGDPKDAPPPITPGTDGLPQTEITVKPAVPFVASGNNDQFRCFVLDPGLTDTRFLNGSNFIAGNPKVVHHALMYLDPNGDSAALADADGGYDCFGGPGIDAQLVGAWAPGGVPAEYPPNVGLPIPTGSKLVMQIHYHPAGTTGEPDATSFQMRFTASPPEYIANVVLIGNDKSAKANGDGLLPGPNDTNGPEFRIPANASGHTETMRFTFPKIYNGGPLPELKLYSVGTHMHYVGTDMKIDLQRTQATATDPANECLLQTPSWNFNWQRLYDYDAAIQALPTINGGDVLNMRCTYDNSKNNPFVVQALLEQKLPDPQDVHLGESTLDEMCLGVFVLLYKNPNP